MLHSPQSSISLNGSSRAKASPSTLCGPEPAPQVSSSHSSSNGPCPPTASAQRSASGPSHSSSWLARSSILSSLACPFFLIVGLAASPSSFCARLFSAPTGGQHHRDPGLFYPGHLPAHVRPLVRLLKRHRYHRRLPPELDLCHRRRDDRLPCGPPRRHYCHSDIQPRGHSFCLLTLGPCSLNTCAVHLLTDVRPLREQLFC
jgi:hypothetical protein